MDLPDGVQWSKNGWYIQLDNGQWRWVAGITEIVLDIGIASMVTGPDNR